jgi:hypothetical protein
MFILTCPRSLRDAHLTTPTCRASVHNAATYAVGPNLEVIGPVVSVPLECRSESARSAMYLGTPEYESEGSSIFPLSSIYWQSYR